MKPALLGVLGIVEVLSYNIVVNPAYLTDWKPLTLARYDIMWSRLKPLLTSKEPGSSFLALEMLLPTDWAIEVAHQEHLEVVHSTSIPAASNSNFASSSRPLDSQPGSSSQLPPSVTADAAASRARHRASTRRRATVFVSDDDDDSVHNLSSEEEEEVGSSQIRNWKKRTVSGTQKPSRGPAPFPL